MSTSICSLVPKRSGSQELSVTAPTISVVDAPLTETIYQACRWQTMSQRPIPLLVPTSGHLYLFEPPNATRSIPYIDIIYPQLRSHRIPDTSADTQIFPKQP
eukprot:348270_1